MAGSILAGTLFFLILLITSAQAANDSVIYLSDLYLDPQNDPCNALGYIANNTLTAVAFVYVLLVVLIQTCQVVYNGGQFMLSMVIGEYSTLQSFAFYALGFAFRFTLHYSPDSLWIFISEDLMIVLSPCSFIAANYALLGHLAGEIGCGHYVLLSVRWLTPIFILSDVTTLVIQVSKASTGLHILLAGLSVQLFSFGFFCAVYARFLYKIYTEEQDVWVRDSKQPWYSDWPTLATALAVSCIGILVRSVYRVVEASQGFRGNLSTSETAFYLGDMISICLAIFVYVPFWPGRFIKNSSHPSSSVTLEQGAGIGACGNFRHQASS
ncbi:RTA1 like protein-domain-containing protein [Suillus plorans]|uniref:RTA1 like protein-domain-containing protein n=1 Tax=Suillus plorans TaxID=116603 RepID=A0A9P7AII2_9AGAM|nr:RTA1 like protein-domain-containing protein [Suillus plorans]KAG1789074.1 RTA1 like protein-domain-containing protein [Suillus plorans]